MSNEPYVNLGVVKFMPKESFEDPAHGLSPEGREVRRDNLRDRILAAEENKEPPKPLGDPVGDWPSSPLKNRSFLQERCHDPILWAASNVSNISHHHPQSGVGSVLVIP